MAHSRSNEEEQTSIVLTNRVTNVISSLPKLEQSWFFQSNSLEFMDVHILVMLVVHPSFPPALRNLGETPQRQTSHRRTAAPDADAGTLGHRGALEPDGGARSEVWAGRETSNAPNRAQNMEKPWHDGQHNKMGCSVAPHFLAECHGNTTEKHSKTYENSHRMTVCVVCFGVARNRNDSTTTRRF